MNKIKNMLWSLISFLSLSSSAEQFKIEVCKQEMRLPHYIERAPIYHIYIKGTDTGLMLNAIGFHTKNQERDVFDMLRGKNIDSVIRYDDAEINPADQCQSVHETGNFAEYGGYWTLIQEYYEGHKRTPYNLFGLKGGKRCDIVAKEALEQIGLAYPWPDINAQQALPLVHNAINHLPDETKEVVEKVSRHIDVGIDLLKSFGNFRF